MLSHRGETLLESRTCLLPMVQPEYSGLVSLFSWYRSGVLPFAGGVMDQPAFYLEAMQFIDSVLSEDQGNG